jgi:hypothetical protein
MNVVDALASLCGLERKGLLSQTTTLVNGTTAGTNAVLTKQGAKLGIICTQGFPDVIELRRVPKIDMFNWRMPFPKPLVPRRLRVEVEERINKRGEVTIPLNEESVHEAVVYLKKQGVEAIVVVFLFSFLNDSHEKRVAEIIKEDLPDMPCSMSSAVLPMIGEYERTSTAVIDAYIRPIMSNYIHGLRDQLIKDQFKGELLLMQNNGGTVMECGLETLATLALSDLPQAVSRDHNRGPYGENNMLWIWGNKLRYLIIDKVGFHQRIIDRGQQVLAAGNRCPHHRLRRGQHCMVRCIEYPSRRPPERPGRSRPGLLQPGRRGGHGDRRKRGPRVYLS